MTVKLPTPVHVVAAVLEDARGRILLTRRTADREFAGLWEFPGGKVEHGENPLDALARELDEELGIAIGPAKPLIRVPCATARKRLLLDVYQVASFAGRPHGREGQATAWITRERLARYGMPPADRPVVAALLMPPLMLVTPEPGARSDGADPARGVGRAGPVSHGVEAALRSGRVDPARRSGQADAASRSGHTDPALRSGNAGPVLVSAGARPPTRSGVGGGIPCGDAPRAPHANDAAFDLRDHAAFLDALELAAADGIGLIQLRCHSLDGPSLSALAEAAGRRLRDRAVRLVLNGEPAIARQLGLGLHLRAHQLMAQERRPLPAGRLVGASCHTLEELQKAEALGLDYAVLGPLEPTATHPGAEPLGWDRFLTLRERVSLPIYAIGGLTPDHLPTARHHGAQGIAAIRSLWPG